MSRNKEKAQSSLNRYQSEVNKQAGVLDSNPNDRPKYVQAVESVPQAEKWRSVVIGVISQDLTRIQDLSLDETTIRDLNGNINKLLKEKRAWEHHIKSIGGPDYLRSGPNIESTGVLDPFNNSGIRYFGRAKQLPELKMSQQAKQDMNARKQAVKEDEVREVEDMEKRLDDLDPSYYLYFGTGPNGQNGQNGPNGSDGSDDFKVPHTNQKVPVVDKELASLEDKQLEEVSKKIQDINANQTDSNNTKYITEHYNHIPDPETIKNYIIETKKNQLLAKLSEKTVEANSKP